jgi:2,3-bisphosphoglycerate-independent phosphoglycerate mutase
MSVPPRPSSAPIGVDAPTTAALRPPLILVVPDGASEPVRGDRPTALEAARTPVLDALARSGEVLRVRTIPAGVEAGTEVGLTRLLGVPVDTPPARGTLEAAAARIPIPAGAGAWRLDVHPPTTLTEDARRRLDEAVQTLGGTVHHLGGHRHLLIGPRWWGDAPVGPHQTEAPLSALARGPFAGIAKTAKAALRGAGDGRLRAWPWGRLGTAVDWAAAGRAHDRVHLLTTGGVAAGLGRLVEATVEPLADVAARTRAALEGGAGLVVVHDGRPDDAAHDRDVAGKVAAVEEVDRIVGSLVDLSAAWSASLVICPDHGCDPATGRHDGTPVPAVRWSVPRPRPTATPVGRRLAGGQRRCTERLAAGSRVVDALVLAARGTVAEAVR